MSKGLQIVAGLVLVVVGVWTQQYWLAGMGVSMIAGAALAPSFKQRISGRNVMLHSAVEPQDVIYGKVRKSGVVVWNGTSSVDQFAGDNEYLWYAIAIAEHEIDSYYSLWLDDDEIVIDGAFDPDTGEYLYENGKYTDSKGTPLLYAWFHRGQPGQVVDPNLEAAFSQWTTNHVGNEVAYIIVRMQVDTTKGGNDPEAPEKNVWYKGAPKQISATIKGKRVYDPRKDGTNGGTDPVVVDPETDPPPHRLNDPTTWEWSDNSVLCRADYLMSERFGPGLTTINWPLVITEANWAGAYVATPGAGQRRYTMNGIIDVGDTIKAVVEQMQSSDFGATVFTPASVDIYTGRWHEPSETMDNSWLAGEMTHTSSQPIDNVYNAVRGQYADESAGYILEEFQPRTAPAYETEDGGRRVWEDITLSMTTNEYAAQRLAITHLKRGRRQETIKAVCNYRAKVLVAHQVITWTDLGTFRVERLESKPNGTVTVYLRGEVEDDWDYLVSDLATPPIIPSVSRYDDNIPPPVNLSTSTVAGGIQVYWDLPPMDYVQYIELYSSPTDDRSTATLVTKGVQEGYYHELTGGDERYYWALSRGWNNLVSLWEPDSANGVYGIAGDAGQDGLTVNVVNAYYRGATAPSTPLTDDGAYNFTTLTLTPPSIAGGSAEDWFSTPPAGVDPLYVSSATFSIIGLTGTDESCIWTDPDLLVSDGQPGDSIHVANVYLRSPTVPATPLLNDGAYNFTTHLLTPPSIVGGSANDWFTTPPEGSDTLYMCTGSFSVAGNTGIDQTVTWTDPDVLVHDGAGYVPNFNPGFIGGTTDFIYALNQGPSLGLDGAIRLTGSEFYHPDGTFIPILTSPFGIYTDYDTTVVGKFYIMYSVDDFHTRFGGVVADWGWGDSQFGSVINTDADGWQAIDKNGVLTAFTPLATDCIVAICEKQTGSTGITSIQILTGGQGTEGLPGQSARTVTIFRLNNQTISNTSGTYADPLAGNPDWSYTVPVLGADGDIAYASTRTFTSDAATPQDATWSTPIASFTRTDGVTGPIGQGVRNTTLYRKNSSARTSDTTGTYSDPIGTNGNWSFELPAITDNNDQIYSMTRVFTSDGLAPQDAVWAAPTLILERVDGTDGEDSRGVSLTMADQSFEYDTDGANPSPANALVTATAVNITGVPYYQFYKNDVSVQNTTSNTYTYVPQADFANMPDKLEVHVREGANTGTIVARDQTSALGLKAGADAITVILSNEAHTLPQTNTGTITYTGSGTDIEVWEGTTQVPYDDVVAYATPSFRVSVVASPNINPDNTPATDGTGFIREYSDANSMIANNASITFEVTVVNSDGVENVFTKKQTFSRSTDGTDGTNGLNGADGEDGADGVNSRTVNLTADDTSFEYNSGGTSPSPATATVTANALNTAGTPYYQFYKNDISVQNSTNANYTYTPQASFVNMPDKIEVNLREGGTTGTIYARDQISMVGIKPGTDGNDGKDAITTILSNEAHTLPTTNTGTVTYTGSGTDFEVWEGTTHVPVDVSSPYASPSFRVTTAYDTNINDGAYSTPSTYVRRIGNHSSMTANNATIGYNVIVKNSSGVETTFSRTQTFAKSIEGQDGTPGTDGETITADFTPSSTPVISAENDGTGYATYTDTFVYVTGSDATLAIIADGVQQSGTNMFALTAVSGGTITNSAYATNNGATMTLTRSTGAIRIRVASTPYDETWTSDSEWAEVTGTYNGVDYVRRITWSKNKATAPATGGGAQVTGGRQAHATAGTAGAYWQLQSNGEERRYPSGTSAIYVGEWLLSGVNSDYEVRATLISSTSGATEGGTFNSWQVLSSTRTWYSTSTNGEQSSVIELKIRRTSDSVVVATGQIVLSTSHLD